jgi:hypothetical protein
MPRYFIPPSTILKLVLLFYLQSVNLVLKPEKQEPVPPLYHEDVKSVSKDHIRCQMYKYFNWMKRNIL